MNDLMIFEGNQVEIILNEKGEPLFELYSTGMALGYMTNSKGKTYPHKVRIDKTIKSAEISTVVHGVQQYLTEEQLYDFMLEAHTDKCKKFKKWITHEVLPKIRKTGTYSTKQMSPMELLKLQYQVLEEHDKELKEMKKDFNEYKENSPLFTIECKQLQSQVRKTAIQVLGGYGSPAYKDNSLRQKVFSDIQRELKRQFDVTRYEAIKRSEYEEAIEIIKNYVTTKKLKDDIKLKNSQIYIKIEG